MPCSAKDRFTVDFEYVFFFVKSKKYFFNQQFEPLLEESKKRAMRGNNINKYSNDDYFPKGVHANTMSQPREYKGYKNMEEEIQKGNTVLNPLGRNKRTTWTIPTKPNPEAHFATFPPDLVKPMIKAGCPIQGIVLDPFAGVGTTCKTAFKLGRDFIGFDVSEKYIEIAKRLLKSTKNKRLTDFIYSEETIEEENK